MPMRNFCLNKASIAQKLQAFSGKQYYITHSGRNNILRQFQKALFPRFTIYPCSIRQETLYFLFINNRQKLGKVKGFLDGHKKWKSSQLSLIKVVVVVGYVVKHSSLR